MKSGSDNCGDANSNSSPYPYPHSHSRSNPNPHLSSSTRLQRLDLLYQHGIDFTMGPRRSHRKSRNGCPECKARRLKVRRRFRMSPANSTDKPYSVTSDIHAQIVSNMLFHAAMCLHLKGKAHQHLVLPRQITQGHILRRIAIPSRRQ